MGAIESIILASLAVEGTLPHLDWLGLLAKIINFVLLAGLLFYVLRKPFANFFFTRSRLIREELETSERERADATARLREVEERFGRLEEEMSELTAAAREEGERQRREIIARAEEEAKELLRRAEKTIQSRLADVKEELIGYAADRALTDAEQKIRDQLAERDDDPLVEFYVQQLRKSG